MRIHYLSQSVLVSDSANSIHVCRMVDAFASLGHEVTLHALRGTGDDPEVRAYYGLSPKVGLVRHAFRNPLAKLAAALKTRVPGMGLGTLAGAVQGRLQLRQELAAALPNFIYSRNLEWLWTAAPIAVPFVLECHAPVAHLPARQMIERLARRPGWRGLVVISSPLRDIYLRDFPKLPASDVLIAHDGADAPALTETERPAGAFRVGYIGHLYAGRGAELILDVARRLPEVIFDFIGGTPHDIARLRALAPANAHFHGHVPHSQTAAYFRTFDAVVAPYQRKVAVHGGAGDTSAFMSPLKLFEYMAWAKPILCSDLPVLREVLTDGETALLLPPDVPEPWEQAIRRLMSDQGFARGLGARARAELEQHYSWRVRCQTILAWADRDRKGVRPISGVTDVQ